MLCIVLLNPNVSLVTSRKNQYSGEEEFCVEVRETGSREQEEVNEQQRISTSQLGQEKTYNGCWSI